MNIIRKVIQEIKSEYHIRKSQTVFMIVIASFAALSYLKPSSTSGILNYLGLSAINFIVLAGIILAIWWFWLRKRI